MIIISTVSPRVCSNVLEVSANSIISIVRVDAITFFVSKTIVSEWRSSSSWFRTQAFQACDPGFKSRRPHQLTFLSVKSRLSTEFSVENCVIKCFKWFSKVLLRLKPNSLDFSTRSLSMYRTKLCLFLKCIYTRGRVLSLSLLYVWLLGSNWFSNF